MLSPDQDFRELQEFFLQSTHERVAEMTQDLERLDHVADRIPASGDLFRHVHALAGLGASYGFPEISRIGETGERLAGELMDEEGEATADVRFQFQLIVESLRDALSRTHSPF